MRRVKREQGVDSANLQHLVRYDVRKDPTLQWITAEDVVQVQRTKPSLDPAQEWRLVAWWIKAWLLVSAGIGLGMLG